jgi:flagellar hook-associated protein 1 FlgK
MSFAALNAALSGLRVAQQQLSVISNNVANVGTEGYTRKILPQTTQVINSTGQIIGARAETIIRSVDLNLERDLWTQISSVSAADIQATYLANIEAFHGPPDKELSIAAQISKLKDSFASLADAPDDGFLLQATLDQARDVASKFNDFNDMIVQMRNDAQDEITASIDTANSLIKQIAEFNSQIKGAANLGRSTAGVEDQRDQAIKKLSEEIQITLFQRGDGVVVIQTRTGVQLADERPEEIFFNPEVVGSTTFYPDSAASIYVGGDPDRTITAYDVTDSKLGGKIGGLLELRDDILPKYQAQIDELAHKMALRFDAQGLRLFTDSSGQIPADTPPDPLAGPPAIAVPYVGFSGTIQVNADIEADIRLIQQGTYASDSAIPTGSNEIIRRVLEFTFGDVEYMEAEGTTDIRVGAPATDLQEWLGLYSQNNVVGGINLASFNAIDDAVVGSQTDLSEALGTYFPNYPADDQFQITFNDRVGPGTTTITLDLSDANANFPIGPGVNDALDQIISEINSQIALSGVPANLAAVATRNTNGQLVIQSRGDVTYDASSFVGSMGTEAFSALGLNENTYAAEDPYFDVQIGNNAPVRVTIAPGDTETDLIDKLEWDAATQTGVRGLSVDFDALTGRLTLRPGIDDNNGGPSYGGDMRIIAGPFETNGAINPALAALPDSVGIVSALFGSYTVVGTTVAERTPITEVTYASEVSNASGTYSTFRNSFLGPGANISTDILTGLNLLDYSQKAVNAQTQDLIMKQNKIADEGALRDLLQRQFLDKSGVNIDEELSNLIVIQTAYAAAARAVSAADEMFQELLNAVL